MTARGPSGALPGPSTHGLLSDTRALPPTDKRALVAFLENLVPFKLEEEEGEQVATIAPRREVATLRVPRAAAKRRSTPSVFEAPEGIR